MLYLKKMNLDDSLEEYNFFYETPSENGFDSIYHDYTYEEFIKEIPNRIEQSKGIGLKEGYVPDTYFFLWNDEHIVGLYKVRHYLNDFLKLRAGHIGYAIMPKYRGKGYCTKGLALAIDELRKIMIPEENEIYLSCNKDNLASLHVMLNNGAYIHHEDSNEYYTRIRVK